MATRFNIPETNGVPSGYTGNASDLFIPSCGVEDVDTALFEMFDKQIQFVVSDSGKLTKVPVVFAAGEKWAMLKRNRPLRDKNSTLILPLITIMRSAIVQDKTTDIAGRGINQQTGKLVIKQRLHASDRGYQQLVNRLYFEHQANLAVKDGKADSGQIYTLRDVGDLQNEDAIVIGADLFSDRLKNAYEIISMPSPQFFAATYKVTFWTQYTTHMNQLVEKLISSYLPQGNALKLESPKGYWFVATIDGNEFTPENNFEDMSTESRIIKVSFNIHVPGYLLAADVPGIPVPIRKYVSAPSVTFELPLEDISSGDPNDPFLGADDPTLPLATDKSRRHDQRDVRGSKLAPSSELSPGDPALLAFPRGTQPAYYRRTLKLDALTGEKKIKYIRSVVTNRFTGETSYRTVNSLDDI